MAACGAGAAEAKENEATPKTVCMVMTNYGELLNNSHKTGWYLPEVVHPVVEFEKAGLNIIYASPNGGVCPCDESSIKDYMKDEECKKFYGDGKGEKYLLTQKTQKYSEVDMSKVDCVFYPGGHGPLFDLAKDEKTAEQTGKFYDKGGIVAAVCHGPAALVPIKKNDGKDPLVKGVKVSTFTDEEETIMKLEKAVPFMLESKLKEQGCTIFTNGTWKDSVSVDQRVITGQNPASASSVGKAIVKALE